MKITCEQKNGGSETRRTKRGYTKKHADCAHAWRHAVVHIRQHKPLRNVQGGAAAQDQVFPYDADLKRVKEENKAMPEEKRHPPSV